MPERPKIYVNGKLFGEVKTISIEMDAAFNAAMLKKWMDLIVADMEATILLGDGTVSTPWAGRLAAEFGEHPPRIFHGGP